MENLTIKYLQKELNHIEYYNKLAPFPIYDTEYVEAVKDKLKNEMNNNNEYDELPVEACNSCGSLHIESDGGNMDVRNICMRCGSVNDLIEYDNIGDYMESKHGKFWNN